MTGNLSLCIQTNREHPKAPRRVRSRSINSSIIHATPPQIKNSVLTIHSDPAARGSRASGPPRQSPCRRGNSRTSGRRGGREAAAAGRLRSSRCRPAACWPSERADSYLERREVRLLSLMTSISRSFTRIFNFPMGNLLCNGCAIVERSWKKNKNILNTR